MTITEMSEQPRSSLLVSIGAATSNMQFLHKSELPTYWKIITSQAFLEVQRFKSLPENLFWGISTLTFLNTRKKHDSGSKKLCIELERHCCIMPNINHCFRLNQSNNVCPPKPVSNRYEISVIFNVLPCFHFQTCQFL